MLNRTRVLYGQTADSSRYGHASIFPPQQKMGPSLFPDTPPGNRARVERESSAENNSICWRFGAVVRKYWHSPALDQVIFIFQRDDRARRRNSFVDPSNEVYPCHLLIRWRVLRSWASCLNLSELYLFLAPHPVSYIHVLMIIKMVASYIFVYYS